jgi:hypothetical protein
MVAVKLGKHKTRKIHRRAKINKILRSPKEDYFHCPCPISVEAEDTGNPLTSHVTKKFNHAVQSRSDYDQYWLQVYNGHSEQVNYNLP